MRIYQRKFDNFASQRNFAHDQIKFKHDWVFHLDADEVFTEELKQEIEEEIQNSNYDAYLVPSKIIFLEEVPTRILKFPGSIFHEWLRTS